MSREQVVRGASSSRQADALITLTDFENELTTHDSRLTTAERR